VRVPDNFSTGNLTNLAAILSDVDVITGDPASSAPTGAGTICQPNHL
jgi:hypothetical protein